VVNISQQNVFDFLKKNKSQWFTAKQISEKIGISTGSCANNLSRLIKHQLIIRRDSGKRYCFEYKYKKNEN